jgi:hypothetical protein
VSKLTDANPKAYAYLKNLNMDGADAIDKTAWDLINDVRRWELVTKSINDRFITGVPMIPGIDRGGRLTKVKRVLRNDGRHYLIAGVDGSWSEPEEKVWVWAMVELQRKS